MEEEATKLLNLSDRLYAVQKGMSSSGEYQEIKAQLTTILVKSDQEKTGLGNLRKALFIAISDYEASEQKIAEKYSDPSGSQTTGPFGLPLDYEMSEIPEEEAQYHDTVYLKKLLQNLIMSPFLEYADANFPEDTSSPDYYLDWSEYKEGLLHGLVTGTGSFITKIVASGDFDEEAVKAFLADPVGYIEEILDEIGIQTAYERGCATGEFSAEVALTVASTAIMNKLFYSSSSSCDSITREIESGDYAIDESQIITSGGSEVSSCSDDIIQYEKLES